MPDGCHLHTATENNFSFAPHADLLAGRRCSVRSAPGSPRGPRTRAEMNYILNEADTAWLLVPTRGHTHAICWAM